MKKTDTYIWILLFVFIFSSCTGKINTSTEEDTHRVFAISLTGKTPINYNEIFKSIKYISLETTDSNLLRGLDYIDRILIRKNCFYIGDIYKITIFNQEGKWIQTINHRGESPSDYPSFSSFDVSNNGEVVIPSRILGEVLIYSAEDKFLDSFKTDSIWVSDIFYYNDSLFVIKADPGAPGDKFFIFDRNTLQIKNSYWPTVRLKFKYGDKNFYVRYKDKLLFHEMQNSNIYEITPDSAKHRYTIDVEGRTPPKGFWERKDLSPMDLVREYESNGYVDNIKFFSESEDHILLNFDGRKEATSGFAWINKSTGKYILFDDIIFDSGFKWKPQKMYALADGLIIIPIPTDVILEYPESDLRKQFPNLKEDDNPILFVGTIR